jgi:hypothetical protein
MDEGTSNGYRAGTCLGIIGVFEKDHIFCKVGGEVMIFMMMEIRYVEK